MPLMPDSQTIAKNIAIERKNGKGPKQAVAIAFEAARRATKEVRDPHKRAALMKRLEEK